MSTRAYEHIIEELGHLTPEERRQLRRQLDDESPLEQPLEPALEPALPDDRQARIEAWRAAADERAAKVGAAWKDNMIAVEAVREQRREL